jgi:hypothetical protein
MDRTRLLEYVKRYKWVLLFLAALILASVSSTGSEFIRGTVTLGLLAAAYFAPALVAYYWRKPPHPNKRAIFVLTLLTAWTGIGWVVALVWAFTKTTIEGEEPRETSPVAPREAPREGPLGRSEGIQQPTHSSDIPEQIRKLAELRDTGAISEGEFEAKKRNLLDRM